MLPKRFRLTFLWRFTIVTVLLAMFAAIVLTSAIENAQRQAVENDLIASALGRLSAELTQPLDDVAKAGRVTPASRTAFEHVRDDAQFFQFVTAVRIYRPNGDALFPAGSPPARDEVHRALAADSFTTAENGDVMVAYEPYFTANEQSYVISIEFSKGQIGVQLDRGRIEVYGIVGGVVAIIFVSLVTLAAGASRELERRRRESQHTFVQTLKVMAETIDLRDPYTAGHSQRVAAYSRQLAIALRLPARTVDLVESGALLHDIGKIAVPDAVLFKNGSLDPAERAMIGTHPVVGAHLLAGIASMEDVVPCVMHHHEKIDGTGYPDHLVSVAIPLGARIIAVADTFDAMTTDRPYRRALSTDDAVREMQRVAGTQLDARMVAAFCELVRDGAIVPPAPLAPEALLRFGRKGGVVSPATA
jgi:putative nucleotidyltransferase with HDIG domain